MSTTDDLLQNAASYAEGFDKGDLAMPPSKKTAVLACMDARLIPSRVLGLSEGEAHIIRNAGDVVHALGERRVPHGGAVEAAADGAKGRPTGARHEQLAPLKQRPQRREKPRGTQGCEET